MKNAASDIRTIVSLPAATRPRSIAEECRAAGLAFLNESAHWGKAELAAWLMGPYARLTGYHDGEANAPRLDEIDARMAERIIRSARTVVIDRLRMLQDPELSASLAFSMISSGFVVTCNDDNGKLGWLPTSSAKRLTDRVLSLFIVDYLVNPTEYETEINVCSCGAISFEPVCIHGGQRVSGFSSTVPCLFAEQA